MNKPRQVVIAIRLMWLLFAFTAISMLSPLVFVVRFSSISAVPIPSLAIIGVQLVLLAGLISLVSGGKNWARWIYGVFSCFSLLLSLGSRSPLYWQLAIKVVLFVSNLAVIYLLFCASASSWFKQAPVIANNEPSKT